MIFNKHSELAGQHAFLSASKPAWLNYDEDKLIRAYMVAEAAARGTRLHDLAHKLITEGVWLPDNDQTLSLYVNDAIGFKMTTEQILYYSKHCWGCADTIAFRNGTLRIHDLKTGVNHTSENQLKIYAALFCLEYKVKPFDIEIELRIYQNNEVRIYHPEPHEIFHTVDKIVTSSNYIDNLQREALL